MKKTILTLTIVIALAAMLRADVYIKQETKGGPQASTQEMWFGTNKMATISDQSSVIMDMSKKKLFIIMHDSKSYIETSLPLDMKKLMPEQMAGMMNSMMSGMEVSVSPNNQTKKVGKWNTKGYNFNIKMMGMEFNMTMWATKDVSFDWKKYMKMYGEIFKFTMNMGDKFVKEFEKLDGYPVLTEMNMAGMNITNTVVEISKKRPAPGVYSVPAGYTKKDKFDMGDMR